VDVSVFIDLRIPPVEMTESLPTSELKLHIILTLSAEY